MMGLLSLFSAHAPLFAAFAHPRRRRKRREERERNCQKNNGRRSSKEKRKRGLVGLFLCCLSQFRMLIVRP